LENKAQKQKKKNPNDLTIVRDELLKGLW